MVWSKPPAGPVLSPALETGLGKDGRDETLQCLDRSGPQPPGHGPVPVYGLGLVCT